MTSDRSQVVLKNAAYPTNTLHRKPDTPKIYKPFCFNASHYESDCLQYAEATFAGCSIDSTFKSCLCILYLKHHETYLLREILVEQHHAELVLVLLYLLNSSIQKLGARSGQHKEQSIKGRPRPYEANLKW